jgi:inward rectifier potassium channel
MTRQEEIGSPTIKIPSASLPREEDRDLGFGSVVAGESRQRLLNQDGTFNVQRTGLPFLSSLNLYHTVISMSWKEFIGLTLLLYFLSNVVFGFFYASFGATALVDTSEIPTDNLLLRGFFFSVQTFATIGYGTIHPVGIIPNLLVTIESYYSMIVTALITGIVFARFARPTARILFSEIAVVAPYRGIEGLMFRMVNGRRSQLIEVGVQVLFSRFVEQNGKVTRQFDYLELERNRVAFFPLALTIVHPIDDTSPMFGLTEEDLRKTDAEILVLISATDESFSSVVYTRSSYKAAEINFGSKFKSIYNKVEEGEQLSIDINKLSAIEKVQ